MSLHIKNPAKLSQILAIFSALDDVRWSSAVNYILINHCCDDFTPDEKLLSHWFCYITDRQTAFERVWEVGGYILSHLVRSFMRDGKTPEQTMHDNLKLSPERVDLWLECPLIGSNKRPSYYDIYQGPVKFASRYMPSDAVSIYRTLVILDAVARRSFIRYAYQAVHRVHDLPAAVWRLAVAFHFLSYADISQVAAKDVPARIASLPADIQPYAEALEKLPEEVFASLESDFEIWGQATQFPINMNGLGAGKTICVVLDSRVC